MEKLLLTRKEAAALSISVDTLDELQNAGRIQALYIGARVYYSPDTPRAFVTKEARIDA